MLKIHLTFITLVILLIMACKPIEFQGIEYKGTTCAVLPDVKGQYNDELSLIYKNIDSMSFIMIGSKGPLSRGENEDVEDELEEIADIISKMKDNQNTLLRNKYCTNIDQFYNYNTRQWFDETMIDSVTLIKLQIIKNKSLGLIQE